MTDSLLPIIRQIHDARDHAARAVVLLAVSDAVLMKYRDVFEAACTRAGFDEGVMFISFRRAAWHAIRGDDGRHKNPAFEEARLLMVDIARGGR
ncbi:MAG: hypothetical protein ACT6QU_02090 [Aliihoeflea sp.]|uniref:hypothetical protein n=1 Tax=Aliihoeflea sp. TaxID=2608088 RepID=UPI004034A1A9